MNIRTLIAVESCYNHTNRHDAIRETWFRDLATTEKKFFVGGFHTPEEMGQGMYKVASWLKEDEVRLPVHDAYTALSWKTQAICRWALDHGFDHVFKCDTDTVVNPWTLLMTGFQNLDYLGGNNADTNVPGFLPGTIDFCSGGAGYWLSRKALTIVANAASMTSPAEDVFVANALFGQSIFPVFHSGYRWRPGAQIDENVVTLHLSSALQKPYDPIQMFEAYQKIKDTLPPRFGPWLI